MRQISNEFMVLSQQDARDILAAIVGSACLRDAQMKALFAFTDGSMGGHGSRHFYSAADLMTPTHSGPRLRYVSALHEEVKALQASEQDSQLLEQTKYLMLPTWTVASRVAAIKRVREISGMGLSEAAAWVDSRYACSASDLSEKAYAEFRQRYIADVQADAASLSVIDRLEADLLELTKPLMQPSWTSAGRIAAVQSVRKLTRMNLREAVTWVDSRYPKPGLQSLISPVTGKALVGDK